MNIKRILSMVMVLMLTIVAPVSAEETNWTNLGKAYETELNSNKNLFYLKTMEGIISQGNLVGNNSTYAKYNEIKAEIVAKSIVTMLDDEVTAAQTAKSELHGQFIKDEVKMQISMNPAIKESLDPVVAKFTAMDTAIGTAGGDKTLVVKPKGRDGKSLNIVKTYNKLPNYKAVTAPRILDGYMLVGQEVYETNWPAENIITIEPTYEKVTFDQNGWIGSYPYRVQGVDEGNKVIYDQVISNSEKELTVKAPKVKGYVTLGQTTKKVTIDKKFQVVQFTVKKVALPDLTNVTKKNDEVCPLLFVDDYMKDQRLVRDEVEIRTDGSCFRVMVYENDTLVNLHREKSKLGKQVVKNGEYLNTFTEYGYAGTQPDTPTDQKIQNPIATPDDPNKPQLKDGEAKITVIYYDEVEKKEIEKIEKDKLKFGKYTIKPQPPKGYYLLNNKDVEIELSEKEPVKEIKYLVRPNSSGSATVTIYHVDIDANEIIKEEILKKVPVGEHSIKPYNFKDYDPAFSGDIKFKVTTDGEKVQVVAKYYKYLTKEERDAIGKYQDDRDYKPGDKPNKPSTGNANTSNDGPNNNNDGDSTNTGNVPSLPDIFPPGFDNQGSDGKIAGLIFKQGSYVSGYPDGTFKPSGTLTRAEAASMIYNVLQGLTDKKAYVATTFTSGTPEWAAMAVGTLTSDKHPIMLLNVDKSVGGGFRVNSKITREEFVDALVRAYGQVNGGNIEGTEGFSDTLGSGAHAHIAFAKSKGLVNGYPDGTFKPKNELTRAEAVAMVNAFIGIPDKPGQTKFSDVPSGHWAAGKINAAAK